MKTTSSFPGFVFVMVAGLGSAAAYVVSKTHSNFAAIMVFLFSLIVAALVFASVRVADQWTRGVVLRLGKYRRLEGPGIFFIFPMLESVPCWIDTRVLTSAFKAEKALTRDPIPVDVDTVLLWKIVDPRRAVLDVADYRSAIGCAAQTVLRDVIGRTMLCDILERRDQIGETLTRVLGERSEAWGIEVLSLEVKDIQIPPALQDAMAMQALLERVREASAPREASERWRRAV